MNSVEFSTFVAALRKALPRFAPDMNDRQTLSIWFDELGSMTTEDATAVYRAAIRSLDSFPSIRQILELAGQGEASPEDKGREVAERIWGAIGRFGYQVTDRRTAEINAFLGPIGAHLVRMEGGWNNVCEFATDEKMTTLKAQWRDAAAAMARKGRGSLDEPPDFAKLPERAQLALAKADVFGISKPMKPEMESP